VVHTCNTSYSGGKDQKDQGSKPTQANSLRALSWKIPSQKRAGRVAHSEVPAFKPQYWKINKYIIKLSKAQLLKGGHVKDMYTVFVICQF
jgi:hypothetical protein